MAKIFFWSSGKSDACTFYRMAEPARVLRARGHDATQGWQVGLATLATSDVVVIQRPTERNAQHLMSKLLTLPEGKRPRIVVELDDDLFSIPDHNPAGPLSEVQRLRLERALEDADRVTVTNQHLLEQAAGHLDHGKFRVVPNYVPERFVVDRVPRIVANSAHTPVITWAGTDTHRRDFDLVAVPLRKLLRERRDFRVRIVGAPYAARLTSATGFHGVFRVAQVPWIEGVSRYIPTLAGHIGLAPLADDLFNRSKSDLRLKELAARGMAVVASDVGPYLDSAVPHFRPDLTEGWHTALTTVLNNPEPREALAQDALLWAQANTLEAHAAEWEHALLD